MKQILTALLISLLLSGCFLVRKIDIEQGNVITPGMVDRLHTGMTKAQVKEIMGSPILMNTFSDDRVDYVYTTKKGNSKMTEKYVVLTFSHGALQKISGNT